MARARRDDAPGAFFHVENRVLDGRRLVEDPADARRFLALTARAVRARRLDVHAYAVLPTRFHLLVSSPSAELSEALKRIQDAHARAANRRRGRRGPLFRGRFRARRLPSRLHCGGMVGYVHETPVRAGLVASPAQWPFSSARHASGADAPPWLDARLLRRWGGGARTLLAYDLVDRWLHHTDPDPPDLDRLVLASPEEVAAWLVADAASGVHVLLRADTLDAVMDAARPGRRPRAWDLLAAGLGRQVAGLTILDVAERAGVAPATAHDRIGAHRKALAQPTYAATAGALLHCALGMEYGALLAARRRERRSG